jgi:hypothetical protein
LSDRGSGHLVGAIRSGFLLQYRLNRHDEGEPERRAHCEAVRIDGINVIFRVIVDGRRVYGSPHFAPARADFRKQIVWSADHSIVVLEVGGERLFGYDAVKRRELSNTELLDVQFSPFTEFGFEGELPSQAITK